MEGRNMYKPAEGQRLEKNLFFPAKIDFDVGSTV
jgi:hypothetical protein